MPLILGITKELPEPANSERLRILIGASVYTEHVGFASAAIYSSRATDSKQKGRCMGGTVFLMYHEIEAPGRELMRKEPGYVRYVVREQDFRAQMGGLEEAAWKGMSVGEAVGFGPQKGVGITFDDGCETDRMVAADLLSRLGFGATFYVTVGFLGKAGRLKVQQLRELDSLGFEIGCHSMTHAYLTDLGEADLRRETGEAKAKLEDLLGRRIEHFSCPGGRYDQRVIEQVKEAGYSTMCNSRSHSNQPTTSIYALGRVPVLRETTLSSFQRSCRGQGLWAAQLGAALRNGGKQVLGNAAYDKMRQMMLRNR